MSAFIEKTYPYALSLLISIGVYLYIPYLENFNQLFDQVTTNSLSISGTLIGFFLTILTIISTITTRRMKFIKDSGLFPRLLKYLNNTIIWHLCVISIGLFLPIFRQVIFLKQYSLFGKNLILFVIFLSWLLSIRFTFIFIKLLHDPTPKVENSNVISGD